MYDPSMIQRINDSMTQRISAFALTSLPWFLPRSFSQIILHFQSISHTQNPSLLSISNSKHTTSPHSLTQFIQFITALSRSYFSSSSSSHPRSQPPIHPQSPFSASSPPPPSPSSPPPSLPPRYSPSPLPEYNASSSAPRPASASRCCSRSPCRRPSSSPAARPTSHRTCGRKYRRRPL